MRIFLMRYFKLTVDEFSIMDNFQNCEAVILEKENDVMTLSEVV